MTADSYHDRSDEQNYSLFLNALAGLEDDAAIENYSREGISHLRHALTAFRAEYAERHMPVEKPE